MHVALLRLAMRAATPVSTGDRTPGMVVPRGIYT